MVALGQKIGNFITKKSIKRRQLLKAIVVSIILIMLSYIFLYPVFRMVSYSFMSLDDLTNPLVNWIPTAFTLENYTKAYEVLDYIPTLIATIFVAVLPSVFQVASTAVIGWGIAMYDFKGKKLVLALVLLSFIIIPQVTALPQFVLFESMGITGTIFALILPALFGQGLKSAIFILIFYSFFSMIPKTIIEAAGIDGANHLQIFLKIGIPSAGPAILISFLFSFVWYWNDIYTVGMLTDFTTLPMQVETFAAQFDKLYNSSSALAEGNGVTTNEAVEMAGTLLTIIPLLIFYLIAQKRFINSADTVGITGE